MDDKSQTEIPEASKTAAAVLKERTKHVSAAAWTAGVSAFFALGALTTNPSWPVAFGVAAVVTMVAVVCSLILRRA